MKTIYKYPIQIPPGGTNIIAMPEGAEILTIQIDNKNGIPMLWALVDKNAPASERVFCMFGTGHEIPIDDQDVEMKYIGTVQMSVFVWHYFELAKKNEN